MANQSELNEFLHTRKPVVCVKGCLRESVETSEYQAGSPLMMATMTEDFLVATPIGHLTLPLTYIQQI